MDYTFLRGRANNPIKELKWERSLLGGTHNLLRLAWRADNPKDAIEVLKMGISAFGLIATVGAVIGLVINYQQGQERLITDRFTKAVEQLGNASPNVQIGGIYSLERIAGDSPKDHWTVMEVLTAYVRDKSPVPKGWLDAPLGERKALSRVSNEVQSALTVIGRRDVGRDPRGSRLNLGLTNLLGADLIGINLQGAALYQSNLQGVALSEANLQRASLFGTDLQKANLFFTDISTAEYLTDTQLSQARLCHTKLPKSSKLNPNRDCNKFD